MIILQEQKEELRRKSRGIQEKLELLLQVQNAISILQLMLMDQKLML